MIKAIRYSVHGTIIDQFNEEPTSIVRRKVSRKQVGGLIAVNPANYIQYMIASAPQGTLVLVNAAHNSAKETQVISDARWIGSPSEEQLEAGWGGAQFQITYQNDPISLAHLLSTKLNELKAQRDIVELGTFSSGGTEYQCRDEDVRRITGKISAISQGAILPAGFTWTALDNSEVPINDAAMIAMGLDLDTHVMNTFANYKIKKVAVEAEAANAQTALDAADQVAYDAAVDALLATIW